jgi:hypothetical protein
MRMILIVSIIAFCACNEQKNSIPKEANLNLIDYLKEEYKVDPQIKRFDSIYIKDLLAEKKSLDIDSLINSKIRLYSYKSLDLEFIEYYNRYSYQDRTDSDCYSIHLIRDNKTGKYYQDFIKDDACIMSEDYCMWSNMDNKISEEIIGEITKEDIKAYNSITSSRTYGENETHIANKKNGIQSYLNSVFKFSLPSKIQLDSLFNSYDKFYIRNDTLLNSPNDLYSYLRVQAERIHSEPNYGSLDKQLEFLKGQINLLLLQKNRDSNNKLLFWIYKNGSHLRVRMLKISGNKRSTYSYCINEYETCF